MKKLLSLYVILSLLSVTFLFAQEKEEEEILPPKRAGSVKLGAAGGFTPYWLSINVDPINQVLGTSNAARFDKNGMWLYGGAGYAYILVLPNVRLGGMGASGTMKSIAVTGNTRRDVALSVSFGGVTADYVVPIMPRLDVAIGILLGSGGLDIKMTRDDGSPKLWGDLWNEYGSSQDAKNYSRQLSGSFFVYQPTVNVEFAILRWLGVRAGVSYLGMSGGSWKLDDKYDLIGVPGDVSGKGFTINTGIFIGTFTY